MVCILISNINKNNIEINKIKVDSEAFFQSLINY